MDLDRPNLGRVFLTLVFAFACFGAGYLVPHSHPAVASTPDPLTSDGTPGGFGQGLVSISSATSPGLMASNAAWPCHKGNKCNFQFDFVGSEHSQPEPPACESPHHCLQFVSDGRNFDWTSYDGSKSKSETIYLAGTLQFYK
jgi:hypothetical protein